MRAVLLFLSAVLLAVPSFASAHGKVRTEDFASDHNWRVYTEIPRSATRQGPAFIGKAQRVCLNAGAPIPCPSGATLYGFPGPGWTANLSAIPDAKWIWAPGVTGASPGDLAWYVFAHNVSIPRRAVVRRRRSSSRPTTSPPCTSTAASSGAGQITNAATSLLAHSSLTTFAITASSRAAATRSPSSARTAPRRSAAVRRRARTARTRPASSSEDGKYTLPKKP